MRLLVGALVGAALVVAAHGAPAATTLTIATVNNGDMIRMQKLTDDFAKANPDIQLQWVTLEENVLRQKVTTDIANSGRPLGTRRNHPHRAARARHRPKGLLPAHKSHGRGGLQRSRSAPPAGAIIRLPRLAALPQLPSPRSNRHSQRRRPGVPTPRGFLPWRLSDDGPSATPIVAMGRHPKPFTIALVP
jgi:hypothetical protein